jgi:hypothetical protein
VAGTSSSAAAGAAAAAAAAAGGDCCAASFIELPAPLEVLGSCTQLQELLLTHWTEPPSSTGGLCGRGQGLKGLGFCWSEDGVHTWMCGQVQR